VLQGGSVIRTGLWEEATYEQEEREMKKYLAICGALVALAWMGVAAAATPQGKATGSDPPVGVVTVGPAQDLSGTQPTLPTPPRPPGAFIDRPTMSKAASRAVKAAALHAGRPPLVIHAPKR
jgi:hypothetical protein